MNALCEEVPALTLHINFLTAPKAGDESLLIDQPHNADCRYVDGGRGAITFLRYEVGEPNKLKGCQERLQ